LAQLVNLEAEYILTPNNHFKITLTEGAVILSSSTKNIQSHNKFGGEENKKNAV